MRTTIFLLALAIIASAGFSAAHAQTVVGQAACLGPPGNVTVDLTGYLVDLQSPDSSQSSGAGAGKVTFSRAEVEVEGSNFARLAALLASGQSFTGCELTAYDAHGLKLEFQPVTIAEVKLLSGTSRRGASAQRNPAPAVRVVFDYTNMSILSGNQGTGPVIISPGGSTVSNGWSTVTNPNQK